MIWMSFFTTKVVLRFNPQCYGVEMMLRLKEVINSLKRIGDFLMEVGRCELSSCSHMNWISSYKNKLLQRQATSLAWPLLHMATSPSGSLPQVDIAQGLH